MKKVLSVALASAMVLGMGANAFAISYSTGSNDKADWPSNFKFDGELFVTNKDGNIVEEASTALNDSESVNFEPGDVIWMPLYADNQLSYDADWGEGKDEVEAINTIELADSQFTKEADEKLDVKKNGDTIWVLVNSNWEEYKKEDYKGYTMSGFDKEGNATLTKKGAVNGVTVPGTLIFDNVERTVVKNSAKFYINGKQYKTVESFEEALAKADYTIDEVKVTVNLEKIKGEDEWVGKPSVDSQNGVRAYGHYTGNIDKNWSINLIEASSTEVEELVAKAELYKATAADYHSYKGFADDIVPNGVYVKITLKDSWKFVDEETVKYYVYVASNKTGDETNKVWVEGNYSNNDFEYVDFTWTNDASKAKLWKVKKGENGDAVFDFADKAFFTVKMYSEESMYLDLSTAYNKAVAGEMDVEADSFFKFDNENANFSRTGTLLIASDDESLVPYSIEDGELVKVDAEYVENYAIAHTNKKVNGFVFKTKQLGNYVLATEEIAEEVEPEDDEKPAEENKPAEEVKPDTKPNPETGAEDFVGLAVSLAVVSVAAAGALALKK